MLNLRNQSPKELILSIELKRNVIILFGKGWESSFLDMKNTFSYIKHSENIPLEILTASINEYPTFINEYSIESTPSIFYYNNGELSKKVSGFKNEQDLTKIVSELVNESEDNYRTMTMNLLNSESSMSLIDDYLKDNKSKEKNNNESKEGEIFNTRDNHITQTSESDLVTFVKDDDKNNSDKLNKKPSFMNFGKRLSSKNESKKNTSKNAPIKPVVKKAPTKTVDKKAPTKTVDKKAPTKTVDKKSPTKTVDKKAPTKTAVKNAPTKTVDKKAPTKTVKKAEPIKTVKESTSAKTSAKKVPTKTLDSKSNDKTLDKKVSEETSKK